MTARIEYLRVQNYRALKDLQFKDITPLTVLLGPNGSGKSTVFDVFGFLSECFQGGLRNAWDKRGRAREIKTRGQEGPVAVELKYREERGSPLITYRLEIEEEARKPVVAEEFLRWRRGKSHGHPFYFLRYHRGKGEAISGEDPDEEAERIEMPLRSPDTIAVNTLGQFAEHPRVAALREFITDWHISYLSVSDARGQPDAGPQERLSRTGDNLPNVVQYLQENDSARLEKIFQILSARIPRLEKVIAEPMADGRLLMRIKDAPFENPILSRFASDGTLKMLAYLVLLHSPNPPKFIGVEEPENFLHPRLLPGLAEESRKASESAQILATTHSPFFLNPLRPEEVRILYRDADGYTKTQRAADIPAVKNFLREGATLGDLWLERYFGVGDPLANAGEPAQ